MQTLDFLPALQAQVETDVIQNPTDLRALGNEGRVGCSLGHITASDCRPLTGGFIQE